MRCHNHLQLLLTKSVRCICTPSASCSQLEENTCKYPSSPEHPHKAELAVICGPCLSYSWDMAPCHKALPCLLASLFSVFMFTNSINGVGALAGDQQTGDSVYSYGRMWQGAHSGFRRQWSRPVYFHHFILKPIEMLSKYFAAFFILI